MNNDYISYNFEIKKWDGDRYHGEMALLDAAKAAVEKKRHRIVLIELRTMRSSTDGEYAKPGIPVPDKEGLSIWCQLVLRKDGKKAAGPWVFLFRDYYGGNSAFNYALTCANGIFNNPSFRAALLAPASYDIPAEIPNPKNYGIERPKQREQLNQTDDAMNTDRSDKEKLFGFKNPPHSPGPLSKITIAIHNGPSR